MQHFIKCADPAVDGCGVFFCENEGCGDDDIALGVGDGIADVFETGFDRSSNTCLSVDVCRIATDPQNADTDGDGCLDGEERLDGTDACNKCDFTAACADEGNDMDGDGCNDKLEKEQGTDTCDPCSRPG